MGLLPWTPGPCDTWAVDAMAQRCGQTAAMGLESRDGGKGEVRRGTRRLGVFGDVAQSMGPRVPRRSENDVVGRMSREIYMNSASEF